MTDNRCIPANNTVAWSAVVYCAYEVIVLLFFVSHFVRGVHKFYFRFVVNKVTASCMM